MAFNTNQVGMATFLLIAAIFNVWFVISSCKRAFTEATKSSHSYQLLKYAVLAMATSDILWVWLCMIQCWNNSVVEMNSLNQNLGDDSFGCKFMGWYSSFSLVSMMGSHCLVTYYLWSVLNATFDSKASVTPFLKSKRDFFALSLAVLVAACLFASMPLIQGDGYTLTSGGFCYAV